MAALASGRRAGRARSSSDVYFNVEMSNMEIKAIGFCLNAEIQHVDITHIELLVLCLVHDIVLVSGLLSQRLFLSQR